MPSIRGFWQQWVFTDLPLYFNITKFHRSFNARRQTTLCMLCHAGFTKRRRRKDRQQYAGPLRRGLHPANLYPRHPPKAGRSRTNHGQLHGAGHVSQSKKEERTEYPSAPLSPFPRISACGSGCGSAPQRASVWVNFWRGENRSILRCCRQ